MRTAQQWFETIKTGDRISNDKLFFQNRYMVSQHFSLGLIVNFCWLLHTYSFQLKSAFSFGTPVTVNNDLRVDLLRWPKWINIQHVKYMYLGRRRLRSQVIGRTPSDHKRLIALSGALKWSIKCKLLGLLACTEYKDAVYCYRCSVVCVSVCLSVGHNHELC